MRKISIFLAIVACFGTGTAALAAPYDGTWHGVGVTCPGFGVTADLVIAGGALTGTITGSRSYRADLKGTVEADGKIRGTVTTPARTIDLSGQLIEGGANGTLNYRPACGRPSVDVDVVLTINRAK
jgi:hypothetical protein